MSDQYYDGERAELTDCTRGEEGDYTQNCVVAAEFEGIGGACPAETLSDTFLDWECDGCFDHGVHLPQLSTNKVKEDLNAHDTEHILYSNKNDNNGKYFPFMDVSENPSGTSPIELTMEPW